MGVCVEVGSKVGVGGVSEVSGMQLSGSVICAVAASSEPLARTGEVLFWEKDTPNATRAAEATKPELSKPDFKLEFIKKSTFTNI